jgi:beta-lactamase superfamily II metal-dependent hydrolase
VRLGACSIIRHGSDRISVFDVNSAFAPEEAKAAHFGLAESYERKSWQPVPGNFQQKDDPDNPIEYLRKIGVSMIFRFILTHPDMDHMGGIKDLFSQFPVWNLWDTANTKEIEESSFSTRRKLGEDWKFYKNLRDTSPTTDPKRLVCYSGASNEFYNSDGLNILAPTKELMETANERKDWNDASYVVLYKCEDKKILFAGDSEDLTWAHILQTWPKLVSNVDVLIAPHHGRDSGRDYEFLNTVNPKLTIFGNASSDHLAYDAWNNRDLPIITNNQAGYIILDITGSGLFVYVKNEKFARRIAEANEWATFKSDELDAWYLGPVV